MPFCSLVTPTRGLEYRGRGADASPKYKPTFLYYRTWPVGNIQKKALYYRENGLGVQWEKVAAVSGGTFLVLGLGVVLHLPTVVKASPSFGFCHSDMLYGMFVPFVPTNTYKFRRQSMNHNLQVVVGQWVRQSPSGFIWKWTIISRWSGKQIAGLICCGNCFRHFSSLSYWRTSRENPSGNDVGCKFFELFGFKSRVELAEQQEGAKQL